MRAVGVASWGLVLGAMLLALGHAHLDPAAHALGTNVLFNGDFETGTDGWAATGDGPLFEVDGGEPLLVGSGAGRLRSTVAGGTVTLRSQYWFTPVEPAATYSASLHLDAGDDAVTVSRVQLRFIDEFGGTLPLETDMDPAGDPATAPFERYHAVDTQAPAAAAYAGLAVTMQSTDPDAFLSVDAASIVLVAAPPPPPPPDPVTSPPPTPTPAGTTTPEPTATATPTPSPTPSITAALRNSGFEEGADGWEATRGIVTVEPVHPDFGQSLVMHATGSTTMWVQQAVTVAPGGWYNAGAHLAPRNGVSAGWVRIAWYGTPDASGAQLSTADSPAAVPSDGSAIATQAFDALQTGAVQAPPGALSARVRILLRPAAPGASMAVDNVFIHPTSPPPPPTPTATPAPTSTATPEPAPEPVPAAAPAASPEPEPVVRSQPPPAPPSASSTTLSAEERATLAAAQAWIRITELLPNAPVSGIDADHEWVELTNLGPASASLEGMRLEDNRAALDVDSVVLAPGASLVIAAPLADLGGASVVQRVAVIGNGLSNTGDRLALYAADGSLVDALSYGSDETYLVEGSRISVPRPGYSIVRRFISDGTFVEAVHSATPSPGVADIADMTASEEEEPASPEQPVAQTADPAPPEVAGPSVSTSSAELPLWIALLLIAGAIVGTLTLRRAVTLAREDRHVRARRPDARSEGWMMLEMDQESPVSRQDSVPDWIRPPTGARASSAATRSSPRFGERDEVP